jgi:hypothetical protein
MGCRNRPVKQSGNSNLTKLATRFLDCLKGGKNARDFTVLCKTVRETEATAARRFTPATEPTNTPRQISVG